MCKHTGRFAGAWGVQTPRAATGNRRINPVTASAHFSSVGPYSDPTLNFSPAQNIDYEFNGGASMIREHHETK